MKQLVVNFFKILVATYVIYGIIISAVWGLLEPSTYFQGDALKQKLGPHWVWIYFGPLPVAVVAACIELQKKQEENYREVNRLSSSHNVEVNCPQEELERYQAALGKRHKHLRENFLKLNLREMSDFYGFTKVSDLEDYEAGLDEFPYESLKKLEDFFFVRPEYLQEGGNSIFKNFKIISNTEDCRYFLEQDFHPCFLCDPNFSEIGHAYLVFRKKEGKFWRKISSETVGGFFSSGGGRNNIYNFIVPFLDKVIGNRMIQHLDISFLIYGLDISFLNVQEEEWKSLNRGYWYLQGSCLGAANHEAKDIFKEWCHSYLTNQKQRLMNENNV
jgi:hypothetical protein